MFSSSNNYINDSEIPYLEYSSSYSRSSSCINNNCVTAFTSGIFNQGKYIYVHLGNDYTSGFNCYLGDSRSSGEEIVFAVLFLAILMFILVYFVPIVILIVLIVVLVKACTKKKKGVVLLPYNYYMPPQMPVNMYQQPQGPLQPINPINYNMNVGRIN